MFEVATMFEERHEVGDRIDGHLKMALPRVKKVVLGMAP